MSKTQEVEIVVDKVETTKTSGINPEVIEKLKIEIEEKKDELENKKYLIPGGDAIAKKIKQFIVKEAKWRFTECIGVLEVNRILHDFITDPARAELMITPVALEALYYFMSKHEGKGLPEAEAMTELIKAINQAKSRAEQDKREFEEMTFRLQSLEHGVDPEAPMNTFKEDEAENVESTTESEK
ncbi:MAG: hypothetical protein WC979_00870 [Candidatus Pacearchaeota archaeon]|jgi:hypothetical protein|nr:hypothetical protein [Clostridia bacterium]